MSDLQQRVPGHSLIDELLRQWDAGTIRVSEGGDAIVIDDEASSWYRGVIGERHVAGILTRLEPGATVLHSVPVGPGSSDIDHIVISTAGVFTINTKYSPGMDVWFAGVGMYVGGFQQPYTRNAMAEARRAAARLSRATGMTIPVSAVVVFVNPGKWTPKAPAGGDASDDPAIYVVRDRELIAFVTGRPVFSQEQVDRIAAAALLPGTWHDAPAISTRGAHISAEFEALEEAVGPRMAQPAASVAAKKVKTRQYSRPSRPVSQPRGSSSWPVSPSRSGSGGRAPARRTNSRRKPKASALERLLLGVGGPLLLAAIAFAALNSMTGR